MKISYHKDTDSLYIHFLDLPTLESEDVAPYTVLHFDEEGTVTGLEIYSYASRLCDVTHTEVRGIGR